MRSATVVVAIAAMLVGASAKAATRQQGSETVFLGVAETAAPAGPAQHPGDVNIKSNLNVNGTVSSKTLHTKEATIKGDASIGTVTASHLSATLVSSDVIETGILRSPSGTITIDANLALSSTSPAAMSFLSTDVLVDGVRQWRLVSHDDFQGSAAGWSQDAISSCGSKDTFLGGHCKFGHTAVTKRFEGLPAHTQVKLVARFHFIDAWNGEAGFAKVDDRYVWADTCDAAPAGTKGINMCGGDAPERKFSAPVDISLAHSADTVSVTFGSTQENNDACAQSWGVDDVMIYVR